MKTSTMWFFRIFSVLTAAAISYGLWSANLVPFSVFNPEAKQAAVVDAEGEADAASATAGEDTKSSAVGADLSALLDAARQGIAPTLLKIWYSERVPLVIRHENQQETFTVHLLNLSQQALDLQYFLTGVEPCRGNTGAPCAALGSVQAALPAKSETSLEVTFNGGSFDAVPDAAELTLVILLGDSVQAEVFPIEYRVNDRWRIIHLIQQNPGSAVLQSVVYVLLTVILAILLMWKVFPYFFPRAYRVLILNKKESGDITELWEVFMSEFLNLQQSSSTPIQPMPLPENVELEAEIGSGDDRVKTILQLINLITPKRGYSLSMKTVQSKEKETGLILNLTQNEKGQIIATQTFWSKDYGLNPTESVRAEAGAEKQPEQSEPENLDIDLYRKLMIPAILWTIQIYNKQFNVHKPAREKILEDEWKSQAMAILGRSIWALDARKGKQFFSEALMVNPHNGMALSGLGRIWLEEAQQVLEQSNDPLKAQEESRRYLRFGLDFMKSAQDSAGKNDSVYYAAGYNAVVGRLYQLSDNTGSPEDNHALLASLESLLAESRSLLCGKTKRKAVSPKFRVYLERFIPLATIVKYSVRLNQVPLPDAAQVAQIVEEIASEIDHLPCPAARQEPSAQDPLQCRVSLNYRVQYNYACFFSRCYALTQEKAYADAALRYLTLALCHGGGLLNYARFDPSLTILHDGHDPELTSRFEAITTEPTDALTPADPVVTLEEQAIANIPGITPEQVETLAALHIHSRNDLLMNGTDPKIRALLAQKSGIDTGLLMFWLNLCDLTRVEGLTLADALKLESIGNVDTIRELANRNAENLHQTMRNLIPKDTLAAWIESAKQLLPILKY